MQCGAYLHDALLGLSASNTAITILCCLALLPIHRLHLWLLMLKPLRAWLLHARSFKIPKGFNISNPVCNAGPIYMMHGLSASNTAITILCCLALLPIHRLHLWLLMLKPFGLGCCMLAVLKSRRDSISVTPYAMRGLST